MTLVSSFFLKVIYVSTQRYLKYFTTTSGEQFVMMTLTELMLQLPVGSLNTGMRNMKISRSLIIIIKTNLNQLMHKKVLTNMHMNI